MNISQYSQFIAVVIVFAIYIYGLSKTVRSTRGTSTNKWNIVIGFTLATILCIYLILNAYRIEPAGFAQIILTFGLVLATALYAISANKQADASAKMAEEMKQQTVTSSRPVIIQKALYEKDIWVGNNQDYFAHFEISNAGNTPAIEVVSSIVDNEDNSLHSIRQTYLGKENLPIKFRPANIEGLDENKTYYLVCDYKSVFSYGTKKPLYQTRLPFKISKAAKGKIYVIAGELEFPEVQEKDRINAFGSKPK